MTDDASAMRNATCYVGLTAAGEWVLPRYAYNIVHLLHCFSIHRNVRRMTTRANVLKFGFGP